jgi:hypothetical protein
MQRTSKLLPATLVALLVAILGSVTSSASAFAQGSIEGSGSIAGMAMVDGKPAPDVVLLLTPSYTDSQQMMQRLLRGQAPTRVKTDASGRYRFDGLPTGRYQISAMTATLVEVDSENGDRGVSVVDGDTVEGIDFAFTRAGAITGAVTTADGRPLIGVNVNVSMVVAARDNGQSGLNGQLRAPYTGRGIETDDRGVFRAYGLRAGKYNVSVEARSARQGALAGPSIAAQTFYPGVTDKAAAGAVELTAGGEVGGIDIKVGTGPQGYDVTGRVVDDAGRGVPDVMVSYGLTTPGSTGMSGGGIGPYTDSKGGFKIQHAVPGSYSAIASFAGQMDSTLYGDTANFEVSSANVSGIELKVHTGLTISGVAVIEGTDDPQATAKLPEVQLYGFSNPRVDNMFGFSRSSVGSDGSFVLKGLPPGKVQIQLLDIFGTRAFEISRVEQNGAAVTGGIQLSPGEPVSGIQVVLAYANCSITGQVTVQGGKLPPGGTMYVGLHRAGQGGDSSGGVEVDVGGAFLGTNSTVEVDPTGNFHLDHLAPGDYQVVLSAVLPTPQGKPPIPNIEMSQSVTLTSGNDTRVSFAVDLSSIANNN